MGRAERQPTQFPHGQAPEQRKQGGQQPKTRGRGGKSKTQMYPSLGKHRGLEHVLDLETAM